MTKNINILIYHIGQLGDTLVALPAIQHIILKHPNAHIVLLTDHHSKEKMTSSWDVLEPINMINQVIFYDPYKLNFAKLVRLLFSLRHYRFRYIYNLVQRIDRRSVYRDRYFLRYLVDTQHYYALTPLHYGLKQGDFPEVEPKWLSLLKLVGGTNIKHSYRLPLSAEAIRKTYEIIKKGNKAPVIVMAPGSKMSAKRWSEKRFSELGTRLIGVFSTLKIIIIGGSDDFLLGERLCFGWHGKGHNLAGKLSIYGSAAMMKRSLLYVGNDTGTMHLAAMVGKPCIAIFSARDYPNLWEPYGENHTILRKNVTCSGCLLDVCVEHEKYCLELISVDEVFKAVGFALQKELTKAARKVS